MEVRGSKIINKPESEIEQMSKDDMLDFKRRPDEMWELADLVKNKPKEALDRI